MLKQGALLFILLTGIIAAQEFNEYDFIHANNVLAWVSSSGRGSSYPITQESGLYWGRNSAGEMISAIFTEGPVFGFKIKDSVYVQGATYRASLNPMPFGVLFNGSYRTIAKVSPDWQQVSAPELKEIYSYSHEYYPAYLGAPFIDNDNNGYYSPITDNPKYLGDEMLWWTSYSNDAYKSNFLYGSLPVNLELQTTVWAENKKFPDVVYKEFLFINHEPDSLKDFYFGYFSDPDVGYAGDDYAGVDTSLGMMYAYNGDDYDESGYGNTPASIGYILLDGPFIDGNNTDTARFNGNILAGSRNLSLTSFQFYIGGSSIYRDPDLGAYSGTLQMYNQIQGLVWNGSSFVNPVTNKKTRFCLDGDPVSGEGWYEGEGWRGGFPPSDRRILMGSGGFNMGPGDTNCVTIAICLARDTGYLNSLTKLKLLAFDVKYNWIYEVKRGLQKPKDIQSEPEIPESFLISGNYPNPFNVVTNINLELPQSGNIKVTVYNSLGEVVKEILELATTAGNKSIQINGAGLSSGVYYYTVLFRGETKLGKFVLLK